MPRYWEVIESTAHLNLDFSKDGGDHATVFLSGDIWGDFALNECELLGSIYVHIAEKKTIRQATKVWNTKSGRCLLANNNSHIQKY